MNQYTAAEKEILGKIADLSLIYGQVELRISSEDDEGENQPEVILEKASDGILRGLMEDELVASMDLQYGELHIIPIPRALQPKPVSRVDGLAGYTTKDLVNELWNRIGSK